MIKIYTLDQLEIKPEDVIENEDIWSYPLNELDYLLENHSFECFLLYNDRLYELDL